MPTHGSSEALSVGRRRSLEPGAQLRRLHEGKSGPDTRLHGPQPHGPRLKHRGRLSLMHVTIQTSGPGAAPQSLCGSEPGASAASGTGPLPAERK